MLQVDFDLLEFIAGSDNVSTGISDLESHSRDESFHQPHLSDVVVWPQSSVQVSEITALANEKKIPLIPWGAGTSVEGNPIPVNGGIVLDMQQMNKVLEIRHKDFQADLEPGITHRELNKKLRGFGLFFPPDPGPLPLSEE
jgi:D-lactate dehydrogenase (cytochrome)